MRKIVAKKIRILSLAKWDTVPKPIKLKSSPRRLYRILKRIYYQEGRSFKRMVSAAILKQRRVSSKNGDR